MTNSPYNYLLFFVLSILGSYPVFSTGVKGTVVDSEGRPVPFAAIYVPAIHHGTTANLEGEFELSLEPGNYELVFQYLGYRRETRQVQIEGVTAEIHVILEEQQYALPEIIVSASGEDPAYFIMRKAIGMSQYYLNQVSEYTCQVYLKGTGVLTRIPAIMRRQFEREGVEQDKYFVTETISQLQYSLPNNLETKVLSTRSSGDDNQTNPMSFVTMSLYRDINGIISPLSRSAFQVYRFQLKGSFMENGIQVNKIKVIPKRAGNDLYAGYIYIKDETWSLHSVDLSVEHSLFSIDIRQVYNPVGEGVWMPVSHDFDIRAGVMGLEIEYKYIATVSNYDITLNPRIDHAFYRERMRSSDKLSLLEGRRGAAIEAGAGSPEMVERSAPKTRRQQRIDRLMAKDDLTNREMRQLNRLVRREARASRPKPSLELRDLTINMEDSARVRPAEYWKENRPVPLTPDEVESFNQGITNEDDAEQKTGSALRQILTGSRYTLGDNRRFLHNGLVSLSAFDYNTVDGWVYSQRIRFENQLTGDRRLSFSNTSGWAFARSRFQSQFDAEFLYHPFRRASIRLSAGSVSRDFQDDQSMHSFLNAMSTLFFKQNYWKLYQKDYIQATHRFDLFNGLVVSMGATYSQRKPLANNSDFYIANLTGNRLTDNIPAIKGFEEDLLVAHNAFILDARLSFTPRYYFYRIGEAKHMAYSHYPTFSLGYREALDGVAGSDARFRQAEASVNHDFSVRLVGDFSYEVTAGRFFLTESLFTPDFRHFHTSPALVTGNNRFNRFRALDYFNYSTDREYLYGHFQFANNRIFLKRLPFLAQSLIREKLFFNALAVHGQKPWFEAGYGLDQVFLFFNAEVVTSFRAGKHHFTGFRVVIPLSGGEIRL